MFTAIKEIFEQFTGAMKKEVGYKSIAYLCRSIENELLPIFDNILNEKNDKFIKNNDLIAQLNRLTGIKARDNYQTIEKMKVTFEAIVKNKSELEYLVKNHIDPIVTTKTMTVKTAAIIKVIQDLTSMTSYTFDILYYILINTGGSKDTNLPKIKISEIKESLPVYCQMYFIYSKDIGKLIKQLEEISEERIYELILDKTKKDENRAEWIIEEVITKTGVNIELPMSKSFIGNPIYNFRMWLVDKDIDKDMKKYETLKVKKNLIELKLMELRLKQRNENNPDLNKQIEYYEERLSKLEYEIAKAADQLYM